jgi:hypothetical protein
MFVDFDQYHSSKVETKIGGITLYSNNPIENLNLCEQIMMYLDGYDIGSRWSQDDIW